MRLGWKNLLIKLGLKIGNLIEGLKIGNISSYPIVNFGNIWNGWAPLTNKNYQ